MFEFAYPPGVFGKDFPHSTTWASLCLPIGVSGLQLPAPSPLSDWETLVVTHLTDSLLHKLQRGEDVSRHVEPDWEPQGKMPDFASALFGMEPFLDGSYIAFQAPWMRTRERLVSSLNCWRAWCRQPKNEFLKRCLSFRFSAQLLYQPLFFAMDARVQDHVLGKKKGSLMEPGTPPTHTPCWSLGLFLRFLDTVSPTQTGVLSTMLRLGLINMEWVFAAFASMPFVFLDGRSGPFYCRNLHYFVKVAGRSHPHGFAITDPYDQSIRLGLSAARNWHSDKSEMPLFYCRTVVQPDPKEDPKLVRMHMRANVTDTVTGQLYPKWVISGDGVGEFECNDASTKLHINSGDWVSFGTSQYPPSRSQDWADGLWHKSYHLNQYSYQGIGNATFNVLPIQNDETGEWSYHNIPIDVTRLPPAYAFPFQAYGRHEFLPWAAQGHLEANLPWMDPVFDLNESHLVGRYLLWKHALELLLPGELIELIFSFAFNPWAPLKGSPDCPKFSHVPPRFAQLHGLCRVLDNALLNVILDCGYTGEFRPDDRLNTEFGFTGVAPTQIRWLHGLLD